MNVEITKKGNMEFQLAFSSAVRDTPLTIIVHFPAFSVVVCCSSERSEMGDLFD